MVRAVDPAHVAVHGLTRHAVEALVGAAVPESAHEEVERDDDEDDEDDDDEWEYEDEWDEEED